MPENFAVPADARLTLAMLRMPPNLNVELFEWSTFDRRVEHPRHSDAGGHHLCFSVADVDAAVDVLRATGPAYAFSASARRSRVTAHVWLATVGRTSSHRGAC